jgi:hypothetical protein
MEIGENSMQDNSSVPVADQLKDLDILIEQKY